MLRAGDDERSMDSQLLIFLSKILKSLVRRSSDGFDEFKDQEYADWRRIRNAIEHENMLVNHRITWLLTSQAFLIAALVGVFNEAQKPQGINEQWAWVFSLAIAVVSMIICLAIGRSLAEANFQLDHVDKWWYRKWNKNIDWTTWENRERASKQSLVRHPEIQGRRGRNVWSPKGIPVWPFTFSTVVFFLQVMWGGIIIYSASRLIPPARAFFGRVAPDQRFIRNSMTISDLDLLYSVSQQESSARAMTINSIDLPGSVEAIEKARIIMEKDDGIVFADQVRVRLYRSLSKKDSRYKLPLAVALSDLSLSMADRKRWKTSLLAAVESLAIINPIAAKRPQVAGDLAAILNNTAVMYREVGDAANSRQYLERSKIIYDGLLKKDLMFREDRQVVLDNLQKKVRP